MSRLARELGVGGALAIAVAGGVSALLRSVHADGGVVGGLLGMVFAGGCIGVAIGWTAQVGRVRGAMAAAITSGALPIGVVIGEVAHAPILIAVVFAAFAIACCRTPGAALTAPPAFAFLFCIGDAVLGLRGEIQLTATGAATLAHALVASFVWLALSIAWVIARIREVAPPMRYRP